MSLIPLVFLRPIGKKEAPPIVSKRSASAWWLVRDVVFVAFDSDPVIVTELVQEILALAEKGIDPREIRICKDVLRRVRKNLS